MVCRIAGVELGGTKCIAILSDADGNVLGQSTVLTGAPRDTLGALGDVLDRWAQDAPFQAIGLATFGPVCLDPVASDYGCINTTPKPGWAGTNVLRTLASRYDIPAAIDTDVNGAALAERRWGAARELDDFAYVTVGTGVGVGLIVNGKPTRGLGHCELGHIRVARLAGDDGAGNCSFHGDCVEGLASGPAIKAMLGQAHIGQISADHPVWDRVVGALAQMCHAMLLAAGPRRILMGGGVVNGQPHLLARVDEAVRESIAGYIRLPDTPIVISPALGDQAGPLGAVALGLQALGTQYQCSRN